jgi:hypothetical protein
VIAKLLRKLLGTLLVLGLLATAVAWTFSITLLDGQALEKTLSQPNISQAAVNAAAKVLPATDPALLKKSLTPKLIEAQIGNIIPQMVDHYTNGAAVLVDFRDVGKTILAANPGATADQLPALFTKAQTVNFGASDQKITTAAKAVELAKLIAPIVVLISILLLVVVAGHHRFRSLAKSFIGAAVLTAVIAGVVWSPVWLSSMLLNNSDIGKIIGPLVKETTTALAIAQSRWLLYIAAAYLGLGVLFLIIHPFFSGLHKIFGHHGKKKHA